MNTASLSEKQTIQESEYFFPYHYLDLLPQLKHSSLIPASYRAWVISLVGKCSGQRVIDIGCGDGRFCYDLRDRNLHLAGLDFSPRAIAFARAFNPNVTFFTCSIADFTAREPYDVAFCIEVLEHIPASDVRTVISRISSCLMERGRLILTVPSKRIPVSSKHCQHFDLQSLHALLDDEFAVEQSFGHVRVGWRRWIVQRMLSCQYILGSLAHRSSVFRLFFRAQAAIFSGIEKCQPEEGERIILVCQKK